MGSRLSVGERLVCTRRWRRRRQPTERKRRSVRCQPQKWNDPHRAFRQRRLAKGRSRVEAIAAHQTIALVQPSRSRSPPLPRRAPRVRRLPFTALKRRIRTVLKAYEAAYDQRDAAALRRIVPGLSAEQLGAVNRTFADAVSYNVEVQVLATNISGSTATVTCLVTHAFVPKIGSASRNPPLETRFSLRQTSAGWVIERIERMAKP